MCSLFQGMCTYDSMPFASAFMYCVLVNMSWKCRHYVVDVFGIPSSYKSLCAPCEKKYISSQNLEVSVILLKLHWVIINYIRTENGIEESLPLDWITSGKHGRNVPKFACSFVKEMATFIFHACDMTQTECSVSVGHQMNIPSVHFVFPPLFNSIQFISCSVDPKGIVTHRI